MRAVLLLTALLALVVGPQAAKLPEYFSPRCSRTLPEPELSKCVTEVANKGIAALANGDRKLRIPSMKPLIVPKLSLVQGTNQVGLTMTWEPAEIWGLENGKMYNVKVNYEKKKTVFDVSFPVFTLSGQYTSSGRVLLLPISGKGPSNMTATNLRVHYEYEWPLRKGADGKEYCDVVNSSIKILGADSLTTRLDGLFNGDKLLGNEMNHFLNENWQDLIAELGPGLAEAVGEVVKLVVKGLADHVPVDEMFAP